MANNDLKTMRPKTAQLNSTLITSALSQTANEMKVAKVHGHRGEEQENSKSPKKLETSFRQSEFDQFELTNQEQNDEVVKIQTT